MTLKKTIQGKTKIKPQPDFWQTLTGIPLVYLVFLILVVLIYFQAWKFTPGNLDDEFIIINPLPFLKDLKNIPEAFTRDAFLATKGSFYRPLQVITFMIDAQFFFKTGSVYYVTNTLIHFATCCALFYLLTLVGSGRKESFVFTLLYLAAPLFVSAVAWAPGRGDLLIGLTGTLTLAFFIKMFITGKAKFVFFSLIAFMAAIFSKETAALIPVMLFFYYLAKRKESNMKPVFGIMIFAGYFVVILTYFLLRSQVVRPTLITSEFNPTNALHNLRVFPEYLAKFLIPVDLSPMPVFSLLPTVLGLFVLAGLIAGIVRYSPKPFLAGIFGLMWYFLLTLPGAMFANESRRAASDYLEHRAYLPMIGIILTLFFIYNGIRNERVKRHVLSGTVLLSVLLGIYSFVYIRNYRDPITFYGRVLVINPACSFAYVNRGFFIGNYQNDPQTAMMDFDKALELKPDNAVAHLNKGWALNKMNDKVAAIIQYDSAIFYEPRNSQAHFNKALVLSALGYKKEALAECRTAININPTRASMHAARGAIFLEIDDIPAAKREISLALRLDSNDALALSRRGLIRYTQNDLQGACSDWSRAAALNLEEAEYFLSTYCR